MRKSLFNSILTGTIALLLISACAEDKNDSQEIKDTSSTEPVKISETKVSDAKTVSNMEVQSDSLMDQPVNFSTPEYTEKTLQDIRKSEGTKAYQKLMSALRHILLTDPEVNRSEVVLYEKLDGSTPNEIIALTKQ